MIVFDDAPQSKGIEFGKVRQGNPEERLYPDSTNMLPVKSDRTTSNLDSAQGIALHRKLIGYYQRELERQAINRAEMVEDEDFYDNEQWTQADKATLRDRGQEPLVYNVISTTVNWVLGTEKRSRTDFKVLPRRKAEGKPAERKTQILKYLSDVNRTPFHRSRAFEDTVKVGVGWLEDGVQDEDDGEPIYSRYESWRNMLWDSAATEYDLSDGRYMFRSKWLDYDVGAALFPKRRTHLREACREAGAFGTDWLFGDDAMDSLEDAIAEGTLENLAMNRDRFRAIECWFRKPTQVQSLRGGDFRGEVFDANYEPHQRQLDEGLATLINRTMMRMHVAIMTENALLYVGPSPYRHNRFPFTPIWCYRRGRDNMPYGMVRGMKDIQRDINKRASKALHILSSNKTIMDEGAVPDLDEFAEEVSRPDGIIVKKQGKELNINADRELAPAHLDLMSRSIVMIQQQSGVTDENLGRRTNASSGIAIGRRQEQGAMATAGIFDNLRFAAQVQGEKQLSTVEQYMTEEKAFRITNMRGTPEYVTVNDGMPENDIIAAKADYVISEQDWRASVRQAQVDELLALLQQLAPVNPQVALVMLDLVVEGMDVPQRDELVRRIRSITGMRDPDAEEPTPEEIARDQAQQAAQQRQDALTDATIADKQASAQQKAAQAQKLAQEAQKAQTAIAEGNIAATRAALETALQMLAAPIAVPVADELLRESGFQSRSEQEEDARIQGVMQGEAEADQAAAIQAAQEQQLAQQQAQAAGEPGVDQPPAPMGGA
ncbi:hypothetical protein [Sphingobium yanoikuyae]|uniref:Portal protein n=1 Tax=Sphingobium yanoikuyae TaxID=13690 RepID=A0A3G2UR20_SPHYA|nr:hypothetical protein [Sphingobium yanoikuyae]AYO76442.1 hypothetical protein EBF16_05475 [Sphingobium yanoikuyae]